MAASGAGAVVRPFLRRFLRVVPHAEFASVGGAHHMVAGDDNAVFEDVLADFLQRRIRNRLDVFAAAD